MTEAYQSLKDERTEHDDDPIFWILLCAYLSVKRNARFDKNNTHAKPFMVFPTQDDFTMRTMATKITTTKINANPTPSDTIAPVSDCRRER